MNKPTTFITKVDGKSVTCDSNLTGFEIHKQPSSYVDYFAVNSENKLFFQFNNGTCFVFSEVPGPVLEAATKAESIGKFYHSQIKGKYPDEQVADRCIRIVDEDEDDLEDFDDPDARDLDFEEE